MGASAAALPCTVTGDCHVGDSSDRRELQKLLAQLDDPKRKVLFMGDFVDDYTCTTTKGDDKPLILDDIINTLDAVDEIGPKRRLAMAVMVEMCKDMPLVRLFEGWEQRRHMIPAYVQRVMEREQHATKDATTESVVHLAYRRDERGELPKDAFSQVVQLLRIRMENELQRLMTYGHPALLPFRPLLEIKVEREYDPTFDIVRNTFRMLYG